MFLKLVLQDQRKLIKKSCGNPFSSEQTQNKHSLMGDVLSFGSVSVLNQDTVKWPFCRNRIFVYSLLADGTRLYCLCVLMMAYKNTAVQ